MVKSKFLLNCGKMANQEKVRRPVIHTSKRVRTKLHLFLIVFSPCKAVQHTELQKVEEKLREKLRSGKQ